jgi:hypothetical protein
MLRHVRYFNVFLLDFGIVLTVWYFGIALSVWYFGIVLTVWYFGIAPTVEYFFIFLLEFGMFQQCGILEMLRQCGASLLFY